MNTIHKFQLNHGFMLALPVGFIARHVADQLGTVCLWAEVNTMAKVAHYDVLMVGTGDEIPAGALYLGTVMESFGQMVWHYYLVAHAAVRA